MYNVATIDGSWEEVENRMDDERADLKVFSEAHRTK